MDLKTSTSHVIRGKHNKGNEYMVYVSSMMGEILYAHKILGGNPQQVIHCGRTRAFVNLVIYK
jgi:hypothetical protein